MTPMRDVTRDEMERELRAAGMLQCATQWWWPEDCYLYTLEEAHRELALSRQSGNVKQPVAGEEST